MTTTPPGHFYLFINAGAGNGRQHPQAWHRVRPQPQCSYRRARREAAGPGAGPGHGHGNGPGRSRGRSRCRCRARAGHAPWRRARHLRSSIPIGQAPRSHYPHSTPPANGRAGAAAAAPPPACLTLRRCRLPANGVAGGGAVAAANGRRAVARAARRVLLHTRSRRRQVRGRRGAARLGVRDCGCRGAGARVRAPRGSPSLLGVPRAWVACAGTCPDGGAPVQPGRWLLGFPAACSGVAAVVSCFALPSAREVGLCAASAPAAVLLLSIRSGSIAMLLLREKNDN